MITNTFAHFLHIYLSTYIRKLASFNEMKILKSCWQQYLPAMICWIFIARTDGRQQMPAFSLLAPPLKKKNKKKPNRQKPQNTQRDKQIFK